MLRMLDCGGRRRRESITWVAAHDRILLPVTELRSQERPSWVAITAYPVIEPRQGDSRRTLLIAVLEIEFYL